MILLKKCEFMTYFSESEDTLGRNTDLGNGRIEGKCIIA